MDQTAYLALVVPSGLGPREAEELVRAELSGRGEPPWPSMEIELFPGSGASLLIARRRSMERVYISMTALSALLEH